MKLAQTLAAVAAAILPCAAAETPAAAASPRILVAYFSWSPAGNTKGMAEQIRALTGGELLRIEAAKPYPKDYDACVEQARKELLHGAYFKPELKTALPASLDKYDVIFLGSPCWWGTMASPMWTFVSKFDWAGKTVVPFNTNGGSGFGRTLLDIKQFCKGATVKEGKAVRDNAVKGRRAKAEIEAWVAALGYRK